MNNSDMEALKDALSDQKTIDPLSSSDLTAKRKREENKVKLAAQEMAEAESKPKKQDKTQEGSGDKTGS